LRAATRPGALAPLGVLALWTGIILSARQSPSEFDWRYMTMSVLLSPRDNPSGRAWAAAGIGLCGLAVLCWTVALNAPRGTKPDSASRPRGLYWLRWGSACMLGAGVLPLRVPGVPKGHEILTLLAFTGLCVGLVRLTLDRVGHTAGRATTAASQTGLAGFAFASLLVAPIVFAGLAQAYVFYAVPELHWVGLAWRARGVPVYLSFAFWEWVTVVLLSVYLTVLGIVVPIHSRRAHGRAPDR
jgi:hypothetical protein